ncbi:hypothetical protein PCE1_001577 [Barthelona sp. PCE]
MNNLISLDDTMTTGVISELPKQGYTNLVSVDDLQAQDVIELPEFELPDGSTLDTKPFISNFMIPSAIYENDEPWTMEDLSNSLDSLFIKLDEQVASIEDFVEKHPNLPSIK